MDDLEYFRSIPQVQESHFQKNQSYLKTMCCENACPVPQIGIEVHHKWVVEAGPILELRQEDRMPF